MDRRTFLRGSAPVALVSLAGCTGGEETQTGESPSDTASETASPTDTPSPTEPSSSTDSPSGTEPSTASDTPASSPTVTDSPTATPSPAREVVVGPNGTLTFQPQSFTVAAGDTVLWRWDSGGHNVSPTEGEQPADAGWTGKDDGTYGAGTTYAHTFDVPGDYEYHCDPHQTAGMVGSFTVE